MDYDAVARPHAQPELVAFPQVQQIAKFKLPERLEVVENFPLTNVGKVSKKDLREDIARKLGVDRAAAASATIVQPQV
ncbi:MAG TPA: hypothetical protein VK898_01880 [Chloroflexota bacterium]|nr:hypothetical protein [Chloroflexota bacterium]